MEAELPSSIMPLDRASFIAGGETLFNFAGSTV
jgi:hypothetical protein